MLGLKLNHVSKMGPLEPGHDIEQLMHNTLNPIALRGDLNLDQQDITTFIEKDVVVGRSS